ncbi:hypothetical protein D3C80_1520890 [compost metagenome]
MLQYHSFLGTHFRGGDILGNINRGRRFQSIIVDFLQGRFCLMCQCRRFLGCHFRGWWGAISNFCRFYGGSLLWCEGFIFRCNFYIVRPVFLVFCHALYLLFYYFNGMKKGLIFQSDPTEFSQSLLSTSGHVVPKYQLPKQIAAPCLIGRRLC